jgi:hypothetical protein
MFKAINVNEVFLYRSPNDPDKNNPTVFQLGVLDSFLNGHIEDITMVLEDNMSSRIDYNRRARLKVKFGLKSLENLIDPVTNAPIKIEFEDSYIGQEKYSGVADKVLNVIDLDLMFELANAIDKHNKLSETEAKN